MVGAFIDAAARPCSSEDVRIELEADDRVHLAGHQNSIPFIRAVTLTSLRDLEEAELCFELDPALVPPWSKTVNLRAKVPLRLENLDPWISPRTFLQLVERQRTSLSVRIREASDILGEARHELEFLAGTEWPGIQVLPELLASFVLPNDPALQPLLHHAAEDLQSFTGSSGGLSGYQSKDPGYAKAIVRSCYRALQATGVRYANPAASFEETGQRIRTPEQVIGRVGTCLDLSVLLAGMLEQAGLHPFIVLVRGHAFVGTWLHEFSLADPAIDDPSLISKRLRLEEAIVVDSSPVASGVAFEQAARSAERHFEDADDFIAAIDIKRSRQARIRPLSFRLPAIEEEPFSPFPSRVADGARAETPIYRPTPNSMAAEAPGPEPVPDQARTSETAKQRLERWKAKLLDLSLRNKLLNFKEGARTLRFPFADIHELEDELADSKSFRIRPRIGSFDEEDPRSKALHEARNDEQVQKSMALDAQRQSILHSSSTPAETKKRLLELYRSSRSAFEESGANILYLALGFLEWYEAKSSELPRWSPILLVPVQLERESGGQGYELKKIEDETRVNTTLIEKLKQDFGLKMDGLSALPEDNSGVDVQAVLRKFTLRVANMPRWNVHERCHLAEFSFAKFLMWQDLEGRIEELLHNPVFEHILQGSREALPLAAPLVDSNEIDATRPAADTLTVVDADPTQMQAIFAAQDGSSFVLQGPPGTGKSQTITNLIAQLLGKGSSVLFVSEKMAALDVVKTRLDKVGLGAFCLELHSNKSSKKAVLKQLEESFDGRENARSPSWEAQTAKLSESRQSLNDFAELLGRPTGFGATIHAALSELIGLRDVPRVDVGSDVIPRTQDQARTWNDAARRLETACDELSSSPGASPWAQVRKSEWSQEWQLSVERTLDDALRILASLETSARNAMDALNLDRDPTSLDLASFCRLRSLTDILLASRAPTKALVTAPASQGVEHTVKELTGLVRHRQEQFARVTSTFREGVLDVDLDGLRRRFRRWSQSNALVRFFMLFGARRTLSGHLQAPKLPPPSAVVEELDRAVDVRKTDAILQKREAEARDLLGPVWRSANTDIEGAQKTLEDARRFRRIALEIADAFGEPNLFDRWSTLYTEQPELIAEGTTNGQALRGFVENFSQFEGKMRHLETLLELSSSRPRSTLGELRTLFETWKMHLGDLRFMCNVRRAQDELMQLGLGAISAALDAGTVAPNEVSDATRRAVLDAWWVDLCGREPRLRNFSGAQHEMDIRRFRDLDKQTQIMAQQEVVARLADRVPSAQEPGAEMAVLRNQFEKKHHILPIRKLFAKVPGILRRMKPCVLMSPLSVAQYLDPSIEKFDVVVFDEASQIPPWDAIGVIARGRQVVIVGDSKQLPPTSFFDKGSSEDEDSETDEHDLVDLESILNEGAASGLQQLSLRWHYRSRHESLIAFSNHHYYDGKLNTFPSAAHEVEGLGVSLRSVPDGFYDRGASRTNKAEAEALVAELERILDEYGDEKSVGVVTFSQTQQRLIEDLVEQRLQTRKDLARHFSPIAPEHVFIKNLENVQGDERDIMLFSVCYAPDRSGKVTMNFGPLNQDGGERRLNVAITRARERLVVFSTLRAEQIDTRRTRAVGAEHLKTFLDYAARGMVAIDATTELTGHEPDSPFEVAVKHALESKGWEVETQVGISGYRLDLAIVHPDQAGTYLAAVECDGAAYHSSLYARERDRLRELVLEGLGWNIHRIWSTDWWNSAPEVTNRCDKYLRELLEASRRTPDVAQLSHVGQPEPVPDVPPVTKREAVEATMTREMAGTVSREALATYAPPAIEPRGSPEAFHDGGSAGKIARELLSVVESAGPIERDEAYRTVAGAWGLSSLGSRIRRTLDDAKTTLGDRRPIEHEGFLFPSNVSPEAYDGLRIPDPYDARTKRRVEHISIEELANGAAFVLEQEKSVGRADLVKKTARLFGIDRLGAKVAARVEAGVDRMLSAGQAEAVDGSIWSKS